MTPTRQTAAFAHGETWEFVCTLRDADGAPLPDGTTAELRISGVETPFTADVDDGSATVRIDPGDQPAAGVRAFEFWATLPDGSVSRQAFGSLTVSPSLRD